MAVSYQELLPFASKRARKVFQLAIEKGVSAMRAGKELGHTPGQIRGFHRRAKDKYDAKLEADGLSGTSYHANAKSMPLPKKGKIKRYILTCAQNNTAVQPDVWENLLALSEHYDADIYVSQFTYAKSKEHNASRGAASAVKRNSKAESGDLNHKNEIAYDPKVLGYTSNHPVFLAPDLLWCGELNILPTAVNPLSSLESYPQGASGIVPHVKIAMQSVATQKNEATRFLYTTGTVTKRNYIPQKAGLKASFHHAYGALLVEVNHKGEWFARQLNADSSSRIYDLDIVADNGIVLDNEDGFEALNPGDIHGDTLSDEAWHAIWGSKHSIMDTMRPSYLFLHDVLDFRSRNHHDQHDPLKKFKKFVDGTEDVRKECENLVAMLESMSRPWCQTMVVDSNHDQAMLRWVKDSGFKNDPVNAIFYLEATLACYKAIEREDENFHLVEWVMTKYLGLKDVRFLREDESFMICNKGGGGIESGMHGHLGLNGAKGSPQSLKRIGTKANTGHTHSCGIYDGLYVAGMSGDLDQGYNRGMSSWSCSHIGTYPNGKRVIITQNGKNWRH